MLEQDLIDYRVPVYEKISEKIDEAPVICYWESDTGTSHKILPQEKVSVSTKKIKVYRLGGKLFLPNYFKSEIFDRQNTILIRGNIRNLFLIPLLIINKILRVKTIVWGQGVSRKRVFKPSSHIFDTIYLLILKLCDAYVLYDEITQKRLGDYVQADKLFVANNTIDTGKEYTYLQKLKSRKTGEIKKELEIHTDITLCFIGRLTKRKKLNYLLDVFEILSGEFRNIGLCIIGKGPEYESIKQKIDARGLPDVQLVGPKYEFEAAKYLYACDIMVMPGWLGLAVNHALIYGLPIVSQRKDEYLTGHAPEAAHLQHQYNGWFAEYNNKEDMVSGIKEIIMNYEYYSSNAAIYASDNLGIERMIDGFLQSYTYVNNKK